MTVTGWPVTVLSRGDIVCDGDTLHGEKGRGRFLECGVPGPVSDVAGQKKSRERKEPSWISA
jgi:hypothetical protein